MASNDNIGSHLDGHGTYQTSVAGFDALLTQHVVGPVGAELLDALRATLAEVSDGQVDFSDLTTITEHLLVLAEYSGLATN